VNEQIDHLLAGTVAPDFRVRHSLRASVSLHELPGQHIVLVFYPFDWEQVSQQQLALYQDYLVEIERLGARLLGISTDHVWSHNAFAQAIRLRFPLLSDTRPYGAVTRLYGAYRQEEHRSARALFVIDVKGIIRFSQVYPDDLNPGVNDILTTLEAMAAEDPDVPEYGT
jgi:peroxiredoxin